MRIEQVESYQSTIFIAGDYAKAVRYCKAHCDRVGLCVTVEKLVFAYTGGAEAGVRIGLINYPRFPSTPAAILDRAVAGPPAARRP